MSCSSNSKQVTFVDCKNWLVKQKSKVVVAAAATVQGGHKPGKPGILRDFSEHGKPGEFSGNSVQPQGKIVTNKVF